MKYLLDTNICIYIIKRKPKKVFEKFRNLSVGEVGISSITHSELCYGVQKSQNFQKNENALRQFVSPLEVLPFSAEVCGVYGSVRAQLEAVGTPIGPLDTLIAAHSIYLGCTLVTNNLTEFSRVEGLQLENWVEIE